MVVFPKGKFAGIPVFQILREEPWYIKWCWEKNYFIDILTKDMYDVACEYVELDKKRKSDFEFSYTVDPNE